ncbi:MAG: Lrp/AsnC family transcriptional regulator [Hydrogenophaga sp.]|uniref:siroheme decarboxylase subunit beta n=1 Tax=Hydrogenophaga sp. TaxID=1904254 RepID=UPI0025BA40FF|nr:Lrp/AsnC family transcriptional regulator [Hydrogenophaga sp.]MBT9550202.1 Lrp/AsnC family transcriptional regulator [Hydrogenophaga sp.]
MDARLRLINDWQHGFPLCADPFGELARETGLGRAAVIETLRLAQDDGRVSRIGGVFAHGSGGDAVLVAMAVPAHRIDTVAALVSAHPGVNHNYLREHHHNLWFVMTGAHRDAVEDGVAELEKVIGLPALRLRMLRPYRIDLGFDLRGDTAQVPMRRTADAPKTAPLPADQWPLARLVEAGLPLVDRPFAVWAEELDRGESWITQCIDLWLAEGRLKRFGVVVRHHELGFHANAMTVFDVPNDQIDACGMALAEQAGVTLAYRRARAEGWPFNLYAMVHGTNRDAVKAVIDRVTHAAGLSRFPREVLFSTRRFKQTGARRFRGWASAPVVAAVPEVPHALAG